MKPINSRFFIQLVCILGFFYSSVCLGQDETSTTVEEQTPEYISLDNISEESERITQQISKYTNELTPSPSIKKIDSLIGVARVYLDSAQVALYNGLETITRRDLKAKNAEWVKYRSELKSHQNRINSRTAEVVAINEKIVAEIDRWELTKSQYEKNSNSVEVYDNLEKIISSLNEVLKVATSRIESIYNVEKRLTELVLIADETIKEIKDTETRFRNDYLVFDHQPIWKGLVFNENDSIQQVEKERFSISETLGSNSKLIQSFFRRNLSTFIVQIAFIGVLLLVLIVTRKKWKVKFQELSNPIEMQSKVVLNHYFASSIVLGVLISAFFYKALIPAVGEFFVLIIFAGTIVLLPKLTTLKFSKFLGALMASYIFILVLSYLEEGHVYSRLFYLLNLFVLLYTLHLGRKLVKENPKEFTRLQRLFVITMTVFMALIVLGIIANAIGMVAMSKFLLQAVLSSTILLMVIYLSIIILTSLIVLIFKLKKKTYELQAVSTIVNATHKRIQPILFWFGVLVWISFVLKSFELRDLFINWMNESLEITWQVGEMNISLGGIISFLAIFAVSILFAKLIGSIFQDEWMIKILPKGVAPASSLLLRIFLISIGLYAGLSAAGVNLSQLGLVVGALGVGIGFGLQNVVLNFIAGLILAFERPINLGDAIQIDNEFGVVTNIGIRSSNIKSYNGYEAIIPNGDLISKKVINWTLSNRDRRSKKFLKTSSSADPEQMIVLFNTMAAAHEKTFEEPAPRTFFKGYDENGNLEFELWYWSSFSDTLGADHDIALNIYAKLKEMGIQAPIPTRRIINT